MAEYRLTPAARRDLEAIWRYTFKQWGVTQANSYIDMLNAAFANLTQTPKIAPACDHIRKGYRCRHIVRHMIYFRITSYGISIVRVLHDRMDAGRYLN